MIKRIVRIYCLLVALIFSSASFGHQKPNIIWIMLEDWGQQLSCYGEPGVQTPNIDMLAAAGIRYTNGYTTAPVCSPSRSAMMTGFHQNMIGANQHRTGSKDKTPLPDGIRPLTHWLKEAGYYTCLMGQPKKDLNFIVEGNLVDGKDWSERQKGQPFFAQITFAKTHRKWQRDIHRPISIDSVKLPPYYPQTDLAKRDWANGLEAVQIVDREIGELIQRLRKEQLEAETLIFLIGDNGRCMPRGKQFLYDGGIQVPIIVKWPDVIQPNQVSTQMVSTLDITKTILNVAGVAPKRALPGKDLFEFASKEREYIFAARDKMDGTHDAMRALRSKNFKFIHNLMPERPYCQFNAYKEDYYPVLAQLNILEMKGQLSKEQHSFMAATKMEYELYDIINDPYELNNLAYLPQYVDVKKKLLEVLHAWRLSVNDTGVTTEFRAGGNVPTYPTRTLKQWEERLEVFTPWVFRPVNSKMEHPFSKRQ